MNRIFLFFGIAVLMFSIVAACGDDDDDDTVDTESDVTTTLSDSAGSEGTEADDATGTEGDAVGTEVDDATGTESDSDAAGTESDDATGTEADSDATGTESDDATGTESDSDATGTESDDATGTEADSDATGTESDDATGTEGESPFGDLGDLDEVDGDPVDLGDITFTVIDHAVIDTQGLLDIEEDMQLLGLAAKIENTSDEDLEINDLTDRIELEDADGETFEVDVAATTALFTSLLMQGDMDMDMDESLVLEAGDEVNGVVAFQVPDDADTTDLVLLLEDEDGEEVEVELN